MNASAARANSRLASLRIHTPEGVEFSLVIATPVTRMLASVVDFFVISAISSFIGSISFIFAFVSFGFAVAASTVLGFVLSIGYGIYTEWNWNGQSIGKRLLHLRVMDDQGHKLIFSQIVIRNILRGADIMPFGYVLGGVISLINPKGQRLGDIAAGTIVIRVTPQATPGQLPPGLASKYNSLREHPHLANRLRNRVSPAQAALALESLHRRDALDPEARTAVFKLIADGLRPLAEYPEEATSGLTDEQYTRNVVEILLDK